MHNEFSKFHPFSLLVYFCFTMILTAITTNPLYLSASILGVFLYLLIVLKIKITLKKTIFVILILVSVSCINPLFNHAGMTVLWYFPTGNALTLESIAIGIFYAFLFFCMILWTSSFSHNLENEKIIYLFSNPFPRFALFLTMILRFIPFYSEKFKEIFEIERLSKSSVRSFVGSFWKVFLYSLENGVNTAESMVNRGFGQGKRTTYSRYLFQVRDYLLILWTVILGVLVIVEKNIFEFSFLPFIDDIMFEKTLILYFLLVITPILINLGAKIQWKLSR